MPHPKLPTEIRQLIVTLHRQGHGYRRISEELNLNRTSVRYWANHRIEKEKNTNRKRRLFNKSPLLRKLAHYRNRKSFVTKTRDFQRRNGDNLSATLDHGFTADEFLAKVGPTPQCYLSGRKIDLNKPETYSFDHITPIVNGGDNSLVNLGLTIRELNILKSTHTVTELISLMKEVLEFQGYSVTRVAEDDENCTASGISPTN